MLLEITNLCRIENGGFTVNNFNLTQQKFEKIAIAGETGSGKTSVLKMIAGFMQPTSGNILFNKQRVIGPDEKLLPGHKAIAYLSQHFELRNNYKVFDLLDMANKMAAEEAAKVYQVCEIEHLLQRKTDQLSGGEKQRIALAKLLVAKPKLLLLDEPFSNLDAMHRLTIKNVIERVGKDLAITCMMVSHDATDMLAWADTIVIMKDGKIIQQGKPSTIYFQPQNEYCAALFGRYNQFDAANLNELEFDESYQSAFIRPEQLKILDERQTGLQANISNVAFCGMYFLITLSVQDKQVVVLSDVGHYEIGQSVTIVPK